MSDGAFIVAGLYGMTLTIVLPVFIILIVSWVTIWIIFRRSMTKNIVSILSIIGIITLCVFLFLLLSGWMFLEEFCLGKYHAFQEAYREGYHWCERVVSDPDNF